MTSYRDNFDRATLGADWTAVEGAWDISANQIRQTGPGRGAVRHEPALDSANHGCRIEDLATNSDGFVGPAVRFSSSANTLYEGIQRSTGGLRRLAKRVSGTVTSLASDAGGGAPPTALTLTVDGSSLALYHDDVSGAANLTATDTSITGNTRCGLVGFQANQPGDDFHAFDLPSTYKLWVEISPDPDTDHHRGRGEYSMTVDGAETGIGRLTTNTFTTIGNTHGWGLRWEDVSDLFDPAASNLFVRWRHSAHANILDSNHVRRMWIENSDGSVVWEDQYHGAIPGTAEDCVAKDGSSDPQQRDPCNLAAGYDTDVYGDGYCRHIFLPEQICPSGWRITADIH